LLPGLADAHHGLGIEEAARRERFSVLADEAAAFDTRVIALAHHQNDQVETILLHLMRGSGLSGVRGMNERSITTVPWWTLDGNQRPEFTIWRPLLAERKQEIEAYSADLGVAPIHDESNDETVFRRNAVRHTVLPAIEAVFPDARSAIVRFAAIVGDEDELLDGVAREALRCAVGNEHELPRRALIAQNVAIQRRIVKLWLKRWITNDALRSERVGAVLELAQANRGGKTIEVGENVTVSLERGSLIARRGRSRSECTKES